MKPDCIPLITFALLTFRVIANELEIVWAYSPLYIWCRGLLSYRIKKTAIDNNVKACTAERPGVGIPTHSYLQNSSKTLQKGMKILW